MASELCRRMLVVTTLLISMILLPISAFAQCDVTWCDFSCAMITYSDSYGQPPWCQCPTDEECDTPTQTCVNCYGGTVWLCVDNGNQGCSNQTLVAHFTDGCHDCNPIA